MAERDLMSDRRAWSMANCSIAAALDVVGGRSALLLLREASFGTRRFADFAARAGLSEPVAAKWLKLLVASQVLARRTYREPGQRAREEYLLTDKGRDLVPVLLALRQWGDRYAASADGTPLISRHRDCGAEVHAVLRCERGHEAGLRELEMTPGPGLIRLPSMTG
jgi:DNA-binding HxlR family transcriptional regulator